MKKATVDKLRDYKCTGQYSFTDPESFNQYVKEYKSMEEDADAENNN